MTIRIWKSKKKKKKNHQKAPIIWAMRSMVNKRGVRDNWTAGQELQKSSSQHVVFMVYKVLLARNSTTVVLLHDSMGRQPITFISRTEAEKTKGKLARVTKILQKPNISTTFTCFTNSHITQLIITAICLSGVTQIPESKITPKALKCLSCKQKDFFLVIMAQKVCSLHMW